MQARRSSLYMKKMTAITNGLVVWYELNDGAGSTAVDSGPNGLDASIKGTVSWVAGNCSGGALDLDGSTTYIDAGNHDVFSFGNGSTDSPFSIMAWCFLDNNIKYRLAGVTHISPNFEWGFVSDGGGKLRLMLGSRGVIGNREDRVSNAALTTGTWVHLAATYDGRGGVGAANGVLLYKDGNVFSSTRAASGAAYVAMSNTTSEFEIGVQTSNSYADGKARDVRVYNRVVSQSEMNEIASCSG